MPALSQTRFLDFNATGQYSANFNPWNDNGGLNAGNYAFAESATAGVNGSGGVSVFNTNDTSATYNGGSWNFSTNGAAMAVSVIVKANGQSSANKVQVGILNTNGNGFYNNSGVAFESFRFQPASSIVWSVREQYRTNNTLETTLGSINIIPGHWYKFSVSLTNTGGTSGSYSAACAIYDYGTEGLTPGTNLIVFSTVRNNTGQTNLTIGAVWPGIRAVQNAGIDAWDNFLVYVPSSKPVFTLALTNMAVATNSTVAMKVLADGPGTISYAWFTNKTLVGGATNFSYTTPALSSSYTNVMVVASNSNGSATNSATLTVVAAALATLTNLPSTSVQGATAILNGQVLNTGNDPPAVTIYYGTANGATNAAAWANNIPLGSQSGSFAQPVIGLRTNTTYYFAAKAVNVAGVSWAAPSQTFTTTPANPLAAILTYHYDNTRQGANTNEFLLTPSNVNTNTFGKLFSYAVDGYVYAEPLYVPNLTIPGKGLHNVVFVATENDTVYAFDADSNAGTNGGLLWQTNLGIALVSTNYGVRYHHNVLKPLIGITSTPVIDPASGTLYVDAFCGVVSNTPDGFHTLHALNITNGTEQPYSPVLVAASVPGTGVDSSNGVVRFTPRQQMNRPGMTLAGGILYAAYGSYGDTDPYHGWVIGFNATNLVQLTNYVFNTTPNAKTNNFGVNAGEGALWMGGGGLCADSNTNIYFEVANGSFSAHTNGGDYGDSFVKLSTLGQLAVSDYFTPSNQATMDITDLDLGSSGPILLPDSVGSPAHPHLLVGSGKEGIIYLVDRDNMGQFHSASNACLQSFPGAGFVIGDPAYFNNLVYYHGSGGTMKAFYVSNAVFTTTAAAQSTTTFGNSTSPAVSANRASNGIVWEIQTENTSGTLHAYNAANLSEIYNSNQLLARDNPGGAVKWTVPTVVNGKVYVGAQYALSVYGNTFLPPPILMPNGGMFTNSVAVTVTDAVPAVSIYYTLDGSPPTTNSILYSGAIMLTNNVTLMAKAVKSGYNDSPASSATFVILPPPSSPRITSLGLKGTTLTISATNGSSNGTYYLLMSTNIALPLSQWTRVLTNTFDGAGNLNLSTNIVNPGDVQKFYVLQVQ